MRRHHSVCNVPLAPLTSAGDQVTLAAVADVEGCEIRFLRKKYGMQIGDEASVFAHDGEDAWCIR